MMDKKVVPVLITWDVDPSLSMPFEGKKLSVVKTVGLCDELGIPATFFVTANAEHATVEVLAHIQASGHEIGCHGLTHGDEENYNLMPEPIQRRYIEEATRKLERLTGTPIHAFRGPRVKTSATTLQLLVEYGYWSDSSVCSQRFDVISSNLINVGWLMAPRRPYHPHPQNAFKKGPLSLWEIPVSALVVPFISTLMNVMGLTFMKFLSRLFYAEARRTGKPIVYLAHPIEFVLVSGRHQKFQIREFTPSYIRSHGLLIRKMLYRLDKDTFMEYSRQLFSYIGTLPDVRFMTVSDYTARVLAGDSNEDGAGVY